MKANEFENQKKIEFCESLLKNEVMNILAPLETFYIKVHESFQKGELYFNEDTSACESSFKEWALSLEGWEEEELIDVFSDFYGKRFYSDKSLNFYSNLKKESLEILTPDMIDSMSYEQRLKILSPTAFVPTESEIKISQYNYFFEDDLWDIMYLIKKLVDLIKDTNELTLDIELEERRKDLKLAFGMVKYSMDKITKAKKVEDSSKLLEIFIDFNWFNQAYVLSLNSEHGGDCTYMACSCMRCHAERRFGINSTVRWSGANGHKLASLVYSERKSLKENARPQV